MPIVNRQAPSVLNVPTGTLPDLPPPDDPSLGSIIGAAFERNNLIGSGIVDLYNFNGVDNTVDPSYSAWDDIKGTPYQDHWAAFAQSNNQRYTNALKMQIDQEEKNNRILAAGGWTSTFANLAAGVADPTIFIPVGGEIAKGAEGFKLIKAGVRTALAGGIATAAQETGLQLTQTTRPLSESAENVAIGTILSGVIGTGAAALLSKPEKQLAQEGFNNLITEVGKPTSAGAAATTHSLGLENLTVDPKMGAGKIAQATQNINPGLRLNFSPSPVARQLGQELGETSVYQTGNVEGITAGPAVERLSVNQFRARDAAGMRALNQAYTDMGKSGINMSFDDFAQAVGRAASNNDVGENEFISRAAREGRAGLVDPLFAEGKTVGLYDEGDKVRFADSYFPRQYRRDEMVARENEIKPQLIEGMNEFIQKSYAKAAEAFRNKVADLEPEEVAKKEKSFTKRWEGKNLGDGVNPHDPSNVPNFNNLSRLIVDDFYDKVTGRDYGSGSSISPDYLTPIERGPIKERTLPLSDNLLTKVGILEKRADIVWRNYARLLSGDIELTRRYGGPNMEAQFKALSDDYAKLREGITDPSELKALHQNYLNDSRDIQALRDLIRGTYRMEQNTSSYARVVSVANKFNFIRKMGKVVIRSLSDMARPAMVHGIRPYMQQGILPLIKNSAVVHLSNEESRLMGTMVDRELQYRAMALSSITDPFERGTAFERFMENLSRIATKFTFLPVWNDAWKGISSRISQHQILSGSLDKRTMAFLGIDPAMTEAIGKQFAEHGEIIDGVYTPHTDKWTDENAVRTFRAAVGKDVDSIIVTPGYSDQPLLAHRPTGRLLLQFKSYEFAAHSKVMLRGLQEGKAKFVAGMISMTTLGMLSSVLASWMGGKVVWERYKKAVQNPGFAIGDALDQAGIFAIPFDIANTTERLSDVAHYHFNPIKTPAMAVGSWMYPNASGQGQSLKYREGNIVDAVGGPSLGTLEDIGIAASGGVDKIKGKKVSRKQQRAAIRLLPFNNFYGINEGIQAMTGDSPYINQEQNINSQVQQTK